MDFDELFTDKITQLDFSPISLKIDGEEFIAFNSIRFMHGKRVAVFKQISQTLKGTTKEARYDFYEKGRCIGGYILDTKGIRHIVNFKDFEHLYLPIQILREHETIHIDLTIGFSV